MWGPMSSVLISIVKAPLQKIIKNIKKKATTEKKKGGEEGPQRSVFPDKNLI